MHNPTDPNTLRDPFQLDRLAEELVSRESTRPKRSSTHLLEDDTQDLDLPLYVPLSHDNPFLTAETFNVEEFLLSRSHTSLPDLRSELRDYLTALKEELVKLINDDYEAFISLSTDLRGEGIRLNRLKLPLGDLKSQILESKHELRVIQDAIQEKLRKRATLREEKALLHLLLKISESVTRLESLLLIALPAQDAADSPEINGLPPHLRDVDDEGVDDRVRGNRAKHLGRVAAEYTQLLYHVSKARIDKCVFVDEIQWRIDRIQSTLSSDLDHLFAATLVALTDGKEDGKATEVDKAKWTADLTECLRTYDILGLWRDAEDILRREVVRGFVKKTIFPGALAASHSPIVPHTPFRSSTTSFPPSASEQLPRTPFTPFSAFALKQNPFQTNYTDGTSSYAHFLDDSEDPLVRLYNQILRFVERDLCRIMDIAEKVSIKSVSGSRVEKVGILSMPIAMEKTSKVAGEGFDIMANVVWAEFGRAIMEELGGIVFASGRPSEFRSHHETSQAFIRSLEFLAPSIHSVEAMRSHPVYSAFSQRWQLPVYFQLRWKEIVGKLEEVLSTTQIDLSNASNNTNFATAQAAAVWTAISTCWSADVFIPQLSARFWKLTLQLLSRYKTWLDQTLPAFEFVPKSAAAVALAAEKTPGSSSSISRASTPVPSSEAPSAESIAVDDTLLQQYATIIVDIRAVRSSVLTIWREEISLMLPDMSETVDGDSVKAEDALRHTLSTLTSRIPPMSSQIIMILTKRCCDALLPVRSIPSQFRAMSNKRSPTEPSYFVSSILRPLKLFFAIGVGEGFGAALKEEFLEPYAVDVFESVSQRYVYYLTAMKKTEESLRRLKKGKKSTFSLFGNSTSGKDDEGRDEERIQAQMILDVEAFGKDGKSLGIQLDKSKSFESLNNMVHANLIDTPDPS